MQKYKDERGKQTDRQTQQLPVTLPVTGDEVIHIHTQQNTDRGTSLDDGLRVADERETKTGNERECSW